MDPLSALHSPVANTLLSLFSPTQPAPSDAGFSSLLQGLLGRIPGALPAGTISAAPSPVFPLVSQLPDVGQAEAGTQVAALRRELAWANPTPPAEAGAAPSAAPEELVHPSPDGSPESRAESKTTVQPAPRKPGKKATRTSRAGQARSLNERGAAPRPPSSSPPSFVERGAAPPPSSSPRSWVERGAAPPPSSSPRSWGVPALVSYDASFVSAVAATVQAVGMGAAPFVPQAGAATMLAQAVEQFAPAAIFSENGVSSPAALAGTQLLGVAAWPAGESQGVSQQHFTSAAPAGPAREKLATARGPQTASALGSSSAASPLSDARYEISPVGEFVESEPSTRVADAPALLSAPRSHDFVPPSPRSEGPSATRPAGTLPLAKASTRPPAISPAPKTTTRSALPSDSASSVGPTPVSEPSATPAGGNRPASATSLPVIHKTAPPVGAFASSSEIVAVPSRLGGTRRAAESTATSLSASAQTVRPERPSVSATLAASAPEIPGKQIPPSSVASPAFPMRMTESIRQNGSAVSALSDSAAPVESAHGAASEFAAPAKGWMSQTDTRATAPPPKSPSAAPPRPAAGSISPPDNQRLEAPGRDDSRGAIPEAKVLPSRELFSQATPPANTSPHFRSSYGPLGAQAVDSLLQTPGKSESSTQWTDARTAPAPAENSTLATADPKNPAVAAPFHKTIAPNQVAPMQGEASAVQPQSSAPVPFLQAPSSQSVVPAAVASPTRKAKSSTTEPAAPAPRQTREIDSLAFPSRQQKPGVAQFVSMGDLLTRIAPAAQAQRPNFGLAQPTATSAVAEIASPQNIEPAAERFLRGVNSSIAAPQPVAPQPRALSAPASQADQLIPSATRPFPALAALPGQAQKEVPAASAVPVQNVTTTDAVPRKVSVPSKPAAATRTNAATSIPRDVVGVAPSQSEAPTALGASEEIPKAATIRNQDSNLLANQVAPLVVDVPTANFADPSRIPTHRPDSPALQGASSATFPAPERTAVRPLPNVATLPQATGPIPAPSLALPQSSGTAVESNPAQPEAAPEETFAAIESTKKPLANLTDKPSTATSASVSSRTPIAGDAVQPAMAPATPPEQIDSDSPWTRHVRLAPSQTAHASDASVASTRPIVEASRGSVASQPSLVDPEQFRVSSNRTGPILTLKSEGISARPSSLPNQLPAKPSSASDEVAVEPTLSSDEGAIKLSLISPTTAAEGSPDWTPLSRSAVSFDPSLPDLSPSVAFGKVAPFDSSLAKTPASQPTPTTTHPAQINPAGTPSPLPIVAAESRNASLPKATAPKPSPRASLATATRSPWTEPVTREPATAAAAPVAKQPVASEPNTESQEFDPPGDSEAQVPAANPLPDTAGHPQAVSPTQPSANAQVAPELAATPQTEFVTAADTPIQIPLEVDTDPVSSSTEIATPAQHLETLPGPIPAPVPTDSKAAPSEAAPLGHEAMEESLAAVKAGLRRNLDIAASRPRQIDIDLHPAHLGQVKIQVNLQADGTLDSTLRVSSSEVAEHLSRHAGEWTRQLQDEGVPFRSLTVKLDASQAFQSGAHSWDGGGRKSSRQFQAFDKKNREILAAGGSIISRDRPIHGVGKQGGPTSPVLSWRV